VIGGAVTARRSAIGGGHVTAGSAGFGGPRYRPATEREGEGRWEGKRRRYCILYENVLEHSRKMTRRK
jgi:hypothetical protein